MVRKAVILPYFGIFPSYFNIWLRSCRSNSDYDWLIFTDQCLDDENYGNIKVFQLSFEELKNRFQAKFDFQIVLNKPYKLCDYKPYYGYLFEEYISEYDFWGYCDCDVIFGRLNHYLSDDLYQKYDKILRTGHLSLIRNNHDINTNFFKFDTYKMVLTSSVIYGYDESIKGYHLGFAGELLESGYSFYQNDNIVADIDFRQFGFHLVSDPKLQGVIIYENEQVFWLTENDHTIEKTEMIYVHLQKRKMTMMCQGNEPKLLVYPNTIIELTDGDSVNNSRFFSGENANNQISWGEIKDNVIRDIKRFLHEPHKVKALYYRLTKRILK